MEGATVPSDYRGRGGWGEYVPDGRERTDSGLDVRSELQLHVRALRAAWLTAPALHAKALAIIERVFDSEHATVKEQMLAVRALGYLEEIERRTRRDEAEIEARRERQTVSVLEAALKSPEGRAALLERTRAVAAALDAQRQQSAAATDNPSSPPPADSPSSPPPAAPTGAEPPPPQ